MNGEKLNNEVRSLGINSKGYKIEFEEELKSGGRTWIITGVYPDKKDEDLKIFYKDTKYSPVHKVSFFDFHPNTYIDLLKIVKKHIS